MRALAARQGREKRMPVTATAQKLICRHCQKSQVNRPRGLCWNCYYTPGLKEEYPSDSPNGQRGVGNHGYRVSHLKLPVPTQAKPGTPEKVEVMRLRVLAGEWLHHPEDAKWE